MNKNSGTINLHERQTMKTEKIYQEDVYIKEGIFPLQEIILTEQRCKELGVKFINGTFLLVLAKTIFYPEGGGQPCDLGLIENFSVIDVFEDKKTQTIYHRLSHNEQDIERELGSKESVRCVLNWNRRFTHMQMHSAEHLVSGLAWSLFSGVNKGFHMGDEYFTIDILFQDNSEYKEFTQEMIDMLQLKANQAVWANVQVDTKYCSTLEEAQTYNLRKPLALDEDITVVLIGSIDAIYDSCACCGTHIKFTGQIGLIAIIKVENYKGMSRFTIKAGLPAYLDAVIRNKVTSTLCNRYSTEIDQLIERINSQETKNGKSRKELYDLKKNLLDEEKDKLLS